MARTASIGIRVEPALKARVEAAAKADGRTVAQWIERLLVREVEAEKPIPVKAQGARTPDTDASSTADITRRIAERRSAAARGRKSADRAMKRTGLKPASE